jgi:hypothetical protein
VKIWLSFIESYEFSCPSNKKFPCIDSENLCDGRQNNKCENVCAAPKSDFPLYDKSTGECKQQYNRFNGLFSYCGQRKDSKHVNNQCYPEFLSASLKLEYRCLNRNNIKESVVAGLKTFRSDSVKRVNYFDYFRDHNETHIKCGNNSMSKNIECRNILFGGQQDSSNSVHCKKPGSETTVTTISEKDICQDLNFMEAKKFPNKTIDGAKRFILNSNSGMSMGRHLHVSLYDQTSYRWSLHYMISKFVIPAIH